MVAKLSHILRSMLLRFHTRPVDFNLGRDRASVGLYSRSFRNRLTALLARGCVLNGRLSFCNTNAKSAQIEHYHNLRLTL